MVDNINDIGAEEVVLFETRPNKVSEDYDNFIFVLPMGFIFSFFLFVFSITLFGLNIIFSIFLSIILGFSFAIAILKSLKSDYKDSVKITNKGIILYKDGTDESVKIPFTKIRNFYCKQGIMDKRVHCADIKINTETDEYLINNINEYREFCRIVQENAYSYIEPKIIVGEEIRKKVTSDENVLWEGKSKTTVLYVFLVLLIFFSVFGILFLFGEISQEDIFHVIEIGCVCLVMVAFFCFLIYYNIKNEKRTYYIFTNKRIIYCDSLTDGTCKILPLEKIDKCYFMVGTKHNPEHIEIIMNEKTYKLSIMGNNKKLVSLINNAIRTRKRALQKQESDNIKEG